MDVLIKPTRNKGEPELSGTGLLLINPGEAEYCTRLNKELGLKRHFLFNSKLYASEETDPPFFWAGPMVGAPMAAMSLEKLIALGGKQFIVYGWCGSLQKNLKVGDLLLPTWATSEEGTSSHYPTPNKPEANNSLRQQLADHFTRHDIDTVTGPVWTTDAPYRETRQKVTSYAEQGIFGVEMEFAALAAVAAFRGVEIAAALLVSDELWREQWTPGYQRKDFRKKNRTTMESLLQLCQTI
ncbi:MAG: nucleoside phosphorylase [Desulfobulbaceae bacterium]|nr:nucleoside phosphorylase [Desulfobulbaceae bacterium]